MKLPQCLAASDAFRNRLRLGWSAFAVRASAGHRAVAPPAFTARGGGWFTVAIGTTALVLAAPAAAQHNTARIVVPADGLTSGASRPYGTEISFASLPGRVASVEVILHNLHHSQPDDLDVLLVSPQGQGILLLSDAGGSAPARGHTIRLSASAVTPAPNASPLLDGATYRPANYGGGDADAFPSPAPPGPYSTDLGVLRGQEPNGAWRLYVVDDTAGEDTGEIQAWTLVLTLQKTFYHFEDVPIASGATASAIKSLGVSGLVGRVKSVTTNFSLTHPEPNDLDVLLVAPGGQTSMLMSDVGGTVPVSQVNLGFAPGASQQLPAQGPLAGGTYRPTNVSGGDAFPPTLPGPHAADLGAFEGAAPNGTWVLFVQKDGASGGTGTLGHWSLTIETTIAASDTTFNVLSPAGPTTTSPFVALTANAFSSAGGLLTWRHLGTGASGVADPRSGGLFTTFESEIPMPEGVNQFVVAFTNANGERVTSLQTVNAPEFAQMFAEGATGSFFDLDYVVANPNGNTAPITIDFLGPGGPIGTKTYSLPARSRLRIAAESLANEFPALADTAVSAVVVSDDARPLVAERAMFWDASGYGGHAGTPVEGPSTDWYFAEGSQGFFDTFLLLANPATKTATVDVRFLVEGGAPVTATYTVAPNSRLNVWAAEFPSLVGKSFGIRVAANEPVVAERAMYFGGAMGQLFGGGHESAGVTRPARRWIFAEGATGTYFDTYLLVSNPGAAVAQVTCTFYTAGGQTVTTTRSVPGQSRLTINVEDVDSTLANVAVSTTITSNQPIVAERAMYWPGAFTAWHEAHNSFGVNDTAERWAVADARQGGARGYDSYVLIVNPEPVAAHVKLTFIRAGAPPLERAIVVPATSRANVTLGTNAPELIDPAGVTEYSLLLETTNRTRIVVEKAMYWNANGVPWAGGSNVAGTRLP